MLPRVIGRLRGSFTWIKPNKLKRRLDQGDAVAVIDVREPDEFTDRKFPATLNRTAPGLVKRTGGKIVKQASSSIP